MLKMVFAIMEIRAHFLSNNSLRHIDGAVFQFFLNTKHWYFFHFALQPDCEEKIILQPQGNQ